MKMLFHMLMQQLKSLTESGVKYEVHPFETTMEGEIYIELLTIIEKMNEKMMEIGAQCHFTSENFLSTTRGITMDT